MHVCAGAPAVQLERKAWSQPVDAGAISDGGKQLGGRSWWAGARPPPPPPSQLARPSGPARRAALADADSDPSHPVALSLGRLGT